MRRKAYENVILRDTYNRCIKRWLRLVILKLGSVKGCQGFRQTKCVMAEELYWRSYISTYESKFVWQLSTLITPSLIARSQSLHQFRSLPEDRGLNGRTFRSSSKANTQRKFCLQPVDCTQPMQSKDWEIPTFATHSPTRFGLDSSSPTIHVAIARSTSVNYQF